MPTQMIPMKPEKPCTATAPTTSSTRILPSIQLPTQTAITAVAHRQQVAHRRRVYVGAGRDADHTGETTRDRPERITAAAK